MSLYGNAALKSAKTWNGHAQMSKNDVTLSQATIPFTRKLQRQHATGEFCVTFIKDKDHNSSMRLRH